MGRRGPQPTPTPLLKLRGSWRAETREGEPKTTPEVPECPKWVREEAQEHYRDICESLHGLGIMARVHVVAVAMLAESLADYLRDRDARSRDQVHKWCREVGMTPAAITSIRSVKTEDKAPKKYPRLSSAV